MGLIYLDTFLVIYLVEADRPEAPGVWSRLKQLPETTAVSDLVVMECLVNPLRSGDHALQVSFEQFFETTTVLSLDAEVFRFAAQLRAESRIKTPDALHLAAALAGGCSALWTNDHRLAKAAGDFAVGIV